MQMLSRFENNTGRHRMASKPLLLTLLCFLVVASAQQSILASTSVGTSISASAALHLHPAELTSQNAAEVNNAAVEDIKPVDDEARDLHNGNGLAAPSTRSRLSRSKLQPKRLFRRVASLYGAGTVALSPLMEPMVVAGALTSVGVPQLLQAPFLAIAGLLSKLRSDHALKCLIAHELVTDVTADLFAQLLAQREAKAVALDWRRVPRSTAAAFLSDDVPFLLWSRWLWVSSQRAIEALHASSVRRTFCSDV